MSPAERSLIFPLTEDHILTLSAESDTLDFKASAKLKENLAIELSNLVGAFANETGGSIIFGIKNPAAGQPLQCDGGFPTRAPKGGTREWLEDVMNGIVQPRLARFNVWEITPASERSTIKAGPLSTSSTFRLQAGGRGNRRMENITSRLAPRHGH